MSWRTWLGDTRKDFADYNLCDFTSMEALCADAAWRLPAKVISPSAELMAAFLAIMEEEHGMTWGDFWELKIEAEDGALSDYNNTPTRASIEVMEMFGSFVDALSKQKMGL